MKLKAAFSPGFSRDLKKLKKKHVDLVPLNRVIDLVVQNSIESKQVLKRRHKMHTLSGQWKNCHECHVANFGDWLLIWVANSEKVVFLRTGTHDELF